MPSFVTSTPFLAVTGVIILILLIAFVASRYKVASANEALIVAGSRGAKVRDEKGQVMSSPGDRGVKVVVGGGTFIRPRSRCATQPNDSLTPSPSRWTPSSRTCSKVRCGRSSAR